jgi:hypothetical protein
MKKLLLSSLLITQFLSFSNLFGQDTLFSASNPNEALDLDVNMAMFVIRTPQCKKYVVSEIGVKTHSTSLAGSFKLGLYNAGSLIYQSNEIVVPNGAGNYSVTIPDGIGVYNENVEIGVAVLPSSNAVKFERTTNFTNDVVGEIVNTNTSILIATNTYPTFPEPFTPVIAWYGLMGMTIKGALIPLDINVSENSGTANDGIVCEGSSVSLIADSPTYLNFEWSSGSTNVYNIVTPLSSTTYTVTVSYGDCENIASKTISVLPLPNTGTTTNDFTISATATGTTYQWINCANGQPIAGATSQSFTATTNGEYAVIVTQNGCSDTSACTTFSTIGIEELVNYFNIYPNPSTSTLKIESNEAIELLEILDLSGKTLFSQAKISNLHKLNIEALNRGIYMIRFTSNNQVVTKQFVKE